MAGGRSELPAKYRKSCTCETGVPSNRSPLSISSTFSGPNSARIRLTAVDTRSILFFSADNVSRLVSQHFPCISVVDSIATSV